MNAPVHVYGDRRCACATCEKRRADGRPRITTLSLDGIAAGMGRHVALAGVVRSMLRVVAQHVEAMHRTDFGYHDLRRVLMLGCAEFSMSLEWLAQNMPPELLAHAGVTGIARPMPAATCERCSAPLVDGDFRAHDERDQT